MASIAQMNVKLALDSKAFIDKLDKASRKMKRTARELEQSANQIFTSVSLPLIGIGVSAVNAAANFESLQNAMTATMGSSEAAAAEIEKLRQAALAPGLDFEQAVKGSVRLQAVGFSAETAREALSVFGNALALAGGSAADLDGVALALTQIASKGKVSAEEINQLAERVPQIRKAMQDAFGTADTEQLQKMGVDAEQFIEKVIAAMSDLPKAQGGLANSITNFGASVRLSLKQLGDTINETYKLEEVLSNLADTIGKAVNWFGSLSDGTKKLVLNIGLAILAWNAYLKVKSGYFAIAARVVDTGKDLIKSLVSTRLKVMEATTAFVNLKAAKQALALGAFAAVVAGVALAFQHYKTVTQRSADATKDLAEASRSAGENVAKEQLEVKGLIATVNDETKSKKERAEAMSRLKEINAEYFGGLEAEKGINQELIKQGDEYIAMLTRKYEAEALIQGLTAKQMELNTMKLGEGRAELSMLEKSIGFLANVVTGGKNVLLQKQLEANAYTQTKGAIEEEMQAMRERLKVLAEMDGQKPKGKTGGGGGGGGETGEQKQAKETQKILAELDKTYEGITARQQVYGDVQEANKERSKALKTAIEDLLDNGVSPSDELLKPLIERYNLLNTELDLLPPKFKLVKDQVLETSTSTQKSFEGMAQYFESWGKTMKAASENAAKSMMDLAASGETSFKKLGQAALKSAADVVRKYIMEGVAAVVSKSLQTLGPLGLAVGGAAGAAAGVLFNRLLKGLKVPAFAQGGLVYGPQLAMVGDNPGAVNDPEVIAPLSKLKDMIGGGNGQLTGTVRIAGSDLLVVLESAQRNRNRYGA
jgi:tape measure domain-containing protein